MPLAFMQSCNALIDDTRIPFIAIISSSMPIPASAEGVPSSISLINNFPAYSRIPQPHKTVSGFWRNVLNSP